MPIIPVETSSQIASRVPGLGWPAHAVGVFKTQPQEYASLYSRLELNAPKFAKPCAAIPVLYGKGGGLGGCKWGADSMDVLMPYIHYSSHTMNNSRMMDRIVVTGRSDAGTIMTHIRYFEHPYSNYL